MKAYNVGHVNVVSKSVCENTWSSWAHAYTWSMHPELYIT